MSEQQKRDMRASSRGHYLSEKNTLDIIQAGCLQRMADAMETTAAGFKAVLEELEDTKRDLAYYKREYQKFQQERTKMKGTISNQKGQITKLKKTVRPA